MSATSSLTPAAARALFRGGLVAPTAGWSRGFTQANLIIVPREQAADVALFAERNPQACPVLGVLEAGETSGPLLAGGDIRTDLARYTVYEHGVLVDTPTDLSAWWRPDLVTFIVGCSFTFETALQDAGVPIAHIDQGKNVPMYRTNRRCVPAGTLSGPLVVSMRPIPPTGWMTRYASPDVTPRCMARRCMWATPPNSELLISARPTSVTRSSCTPGTFRSSGPVASPRRRP